MIAILADDFSGAAELAGIAAACGMKAEVQTVFDPASHADVIAVDTDTRLKSEDEAVRVVREVTRQMMTSQPAWIYKKTDSVLRGHIRSEIETILDVTGLASCVFIPANPSKDRIICEGRYLIECVPLHKTVFATDPDYPRRSNHVRELLGESSRIRTPNALVPDDLRLVLPEGVLAAGAADFFTARLESSMRVVPPRCGSINPPTPSRLKAERCVLLCGSLAAWDTGRAAQMQERGFVIKTLDEPVLPQVWQSTSRLMLAIGRPEEASASELIQRLVEKALPLLEMSENFCIGLEGGATAIAFMRQMGWTSFEVLPEGHTGVGTLQPPGGPILCVKPGSYRWPESLFR